MNDNSDYGSEFKLDAIIHSVYSEEDLVVSTMSIPSSDHHRIHRQVTIQDSNDLDEEENGIVGKIGVLGTVITRSEANTHALAAPVNYNASGCANQPKDHIALADPS